MRRMKLLVCALSLVLVSGAKQVDNEVVCLYEEWPNPVEKIETVSRFNDLVPKTGVTENNILLHLFTSKCTEGLNSPFFVGAHYQTGPSVLHLAQMEYDQMYPNLFEEWNLQKNCSLFVFIPIGKSFADFRDFPVLKDASSRSFTAFLSRNRRTHTEFVNNYGKKVKFYWYEKNPKYLDVMLPNQARTEHTFLGHIFKATDAEDDSFIDLYLIDGSEQFLISRNKMKTWCADKGLDEDSTKCVEEYEAEMIDWAYKFWARKREALNFAQPQIVPNFTTKGFAKTKLPREIYDSVLEFWKQRYEADDFVQEGYAGPVLNQYTSPTFMAHLPDYQRNLLITHFQKVLAEWGGLSGPQDLEMTSLYGIRKYERGAVLHMHVDTCSTHVLSAIVNVASELDEGKDWPLQIYDHQGQLHEFGMEPGEVVFYESAKCGHSRRKPLPGRYYANLFIHFKPSGKWDFDWF